MSIPFFHPTRQSGRYRLFALALILSFTVATTAPLSASQLDIAAQLNTGQATITGPAIDIGSLANLFDGNTSTLARSQSINPMVITLSFNAPQQLNRSRIWFLAGDNRWRLETADSLADLNGQTGSYRVALDWATGPESSWQDRSFAALTCKVARLTLQRLTGDNYVHLCEWQLFVYDAPFVLTQLQRVEANTQVSWNGTPGQWYELQCSSNLLSWTNAGFQKAASNSVSLSVTGSLPAKAFYRLRKALPEDRPAIIRRVLVLNIDPILESHGGQRLNQYLHWNDPHTLTAGYFNDLSTDSGGYVQWQVAAWVDLDLWPRKADGFQYTDDSYLQCWSNPQLYPFHSPDGVDYDALLDLPLPTLNNRTAHQIAAAGEVDEVICWAFPYSGFYESRMVGSTAYWCNSPGLTRPSCLYVLMGLNPQRGVAEAIHSFGHRCESILTHAYGSWSSTATINHLWDRFTRVGPTHNVSVAGCGNVHFPPNGTNDYDYANLKPVTSEANRWLTYPNLSGPTASVSAATWGGPDYQRNFLNWWMVRFPKAPGRYVDTTNTINNGKLNNWWAYVVDMNEYTESR